VWLIYALGGGWGHLTRAVALARVAQRDRPVRILTNSPYAGMVADALPALDIVGLDAGMPAEATRAAAVRAIAECQPSCLIVDTFPRGIGGELAGLLGTMFARKVLVQRDLNPRYVAAAQLGRFVAAHYDLVVVPGAGEYGGAAECHITAPWVVRCAGEIPRRGRVKEVLGLGSDEERCVLVCASGRADELEWYGSVAAHVRRLDRAAAVRCVAAERPPGCPEECWVRYWPAMDLFGCASVVVGGGGYNTVNECLAWNVWLLARPWPRAYDRQELRVQRASTGGRVVGVKEPAEAARLALAHFGDGPVGAPGFVNGAVEAAERIAGLL
jgi:UDP:flavonoid glycosyltransferase YjiC (YdhE family)